jgi:hypothetical protein
VRDGLATAEADLLRIQSALEQLGG